jgi:hypothetical protein
MLEKVFPLHKADFIVSASEFREGGRLMGVPILFLPHFVYAKEESLAQPGGLQSYLSAGHKIALPKGDPGLWYRELFNIGQESVHWIEPQGDESIFLEGVAQVAIADRSWLAKGRIPQIQVFPFTSLAPASSVPDWGIRLAISNNCANTALAETILKTALVDLQEKFIGSGGGAFPVRRSVYQSPRIQGAFLSAPKKVFDTTLDRLGTTH